MAIAYACSLHSVIDLRKPETESAMAPPQAEVAAVKAAMQKRVEEAVAETEAKASGLRDAREKNVHFSARVVALNARVAAQQKDLRALTAVNASLTQELEQLRSLRSRPAEPAPLENGGCFCTHSCAANFGNI